MVLMLTRLSRPLQSDIGEQAPPAEGKMKMSGFFLSKEQAFGFNIYSYASSRQTPYTSL